MFGPCFVMQYILIVLSSLQSFSRGRESWLLYFVFLLLCGQCSMSLSHGAVT